MDLSLRTALRRGASALFGELRWQPPAWLRALAAKARARRRAVAFCLLLLALAGGAGAWGWRWWQRRPKPRFVVVRVEPPGVTPLSDKLLPECLNVRFSEPAAPLGLVGKSPPPDDVRLDPPLPGTWRWIGDSCLRFTPGQDWPADQALRIVLDPRAALAPHVRLERTEWTARTPPLAARFTAATFYQDPKDPAVQQVTATLEFTHPVAADEVARHLSLKLLGDSPVFRAADAARPWTISPGRHGREWFLRTVPLALPEREDWMKWTLAPGVAATLGGARTRDGDERKVRVPDLGSFFRIEGVETHLVRNAAGEPEQFLLVRTTAAARTEDLAKALTLFQLPKTNPHRDHENPDPEREEPRSRHGGDDDEENEDGADHPAEQTDDEADTSTAASVDDAAPDDWSTGDVDADALALSRPVPATPVPAAQEFSTEHTFRFHVEDDGQICVKIAYGVQALGGFPLRDEHTAVAGIPQPEPEIAIQGAGGVLALGGERKLSVKSRGVRAIRYDIARVPAGEINHLVSQTEGDFQNPEFLGSRFDENDLARVASETQPIVLQNRVRANFSAFDFTAHLKPAADGAREGLFFLTASAWDPAKKRRVGQTGDRRFVLVTNLGLLVKANADGSRDVFVQHLRTGAPAGGVTVQILGRNGVTLASAPTDADGRASLPALGTTEHPASSERSARDPVAITARRGDDVAFLPFRPRDRQLDFSRWDIAGVRTKTGAELQAFVFTERGVYRPGDELHAGVMVKRRDWGALPAGLPLETEVLDARGLSVQVKRVPLPANGFFEFECPTAAESPTGPWTLQVYLTRADGKRAGLLGTAGVQVKEFLPDRLKIDTRLSRSAPARGGWVGPEAMQAAVSLQNLYGTPAESRRVKAQMRLQPREFGFKEFAGFTFYDRLREEKKPWDGETIELGEQTTDAAGAAGFGLDLERFKDATYRLTFDAEGFEAEGGRSVEEACGTLVSPLSYVVGWQADGSLDYIEAGRDRTLKLIALDPALNRIALEGVRVNLIEQTFVSVLTKRPNGNWEYESVSREKPVGSETVTLPPDGFTYPMPTKTPGNFRLDFTDRDGARLAKVAFHVAGQGAVSRTLDKNAELEIKLAKEEFRAGDTVEISLVAPYAGSGLITIERDHVYAHRWFQASTTSSVQTIAIPPDFDGTGYVNVAFIRAPDSPEVFASPLSYGVASFTVNRERRKLGVSLTSAAQAKPGEPLRIGYKTDRPAKIVVYAVDQGILQVTRYKLPDPLAWMFRKAALTVRTTQIVDLILPEFSVLRAAAAPGGDGEDDPGVLNPFRRVTERPVVFWSGVLDADGTEREVVYPVPEGFSGTLALMAVAVAPDAVGATRRDTLVHGAFTLTAGVPTLAAPGDQFEVGVTVANGAAGSGPDARVRLTAESSEALEILRAPTEPLRVPEGRETTATFAVRVRETLGSARLGFRAQLDSGSGDGEESQVHAAISVRPPTPFMTSVRGGRFTGNSVEVPVERAMLPAFRQAHAMVSTVPLGLAHGLQRFLQNYPNGCTEQITSGAFARVALAGEADFGLSRVETVAQLEKTFATLRRRQNAQGAFGYWTAASDKAGGIDFLSAYVVHFLIEARAAGFTVPEDLLQNGLKGLRKSVATEPRNLREARTLAYAIYLLTRENVVTTNYLLNLRDWLDRHEKERWPRDLTGAYVAGSLALLKKEDEAQRLIRAYQPGVWDRRELGDFYDVLGADSQGVALLAMHFPERLKTLGAEGFLTILEPIGHGNFSTLSAAYATLALKRYSLLAAGTPRPLGIGEVSGAKTETALRTEGGAGTRRAEFSAAAAALRFHAEGGAAPGGFGTFYQVTEAGFDRGLPAGSLAEGMEVFRELLDARGQPVTRVKLGEHVTVRLRVRSLGGRTITNAAILDLLPGGFEIVGSSLSPGPGGAVGMDFVEVREDRAVFFGTLTPAVREIRYEIKPVNRGEFTVPPPFAESMYDRTLRARGLPGRITVIATP